ncbi:MAG TPA: hypothetical protein VN618_07140 [Solirubrobacteraceae bacterium]|nr:hypothetical protein [Solirubrobacteraceae bacterium]
MRRHLSYANVVATLALVFAMSGSAIAAKHYLLSSTKQIKPSLLKQLRKAGPRGPAGPAGTPGGAGPTGPSGATAGTAVPDQSGEAILTDAATGLSVSEAKGVPAFRLSNAGTNVLTVAGVVETPLNTVTAWEVQLKPGEAANSPTNAAQTNYLDVTVVRAGSTLATSPIVHLTCGITGEGAGAANCLASH